jgi:radical SAM protein with 4Fe4S-binding SPASM domain
MKGSHSGSFDAIHRNMMVALDKGLLEKIDIRVNLDRQNRGRALELFELLAKDGIQAKTHLSLGIIANTLPRDECHSGANGYFAQYGFSEDEAVEEYLEATKSALSFGFEPAEELIVGPWCVARHPHAWTIGPDLEIYKCLSMVGRPDGVIGNLPEVPDNNEVTEYTIGKIKSCLAEGCPMVPVCGGGCLFDERVSGKRNCPRSLLERVNIGLMTINHSQ